MYLEKLEISNYKMFDNIKLEFEPGFNIILGDNGVGKTTILEAASVAISGFLTGMEDVPTRNTSISRMLDMKLLKIVWVFLIKYIMMNQHKFVVF